MNDEYKLTSVSLRPLEVKALSRMAKESDMSRSAVMRKLIRRMAQEQGYPIDKLVETDA